MSAEFRKMFRNCNLDRDRNSRLKIGNTEAYTRVRSLKTTV